MRLFHRNRLFIIALPLWIFMVGVLTASAQSTPPTPLSVGQNNTGEITQAAPSVSYSVTVTAPQVVQIEAFGITAGFLPTFQVTDASGVTVLSAVNSTNQTAMQAPLLLSSAGTYLIVVQSANNQPGQFLISIQPGPTLPTPQALTPGQALNGSLGSQTPLQVYSFTASATDVQLLNVISGAPTSGPIVTLKDADNGTTLAVNSPQLAGVRYRIPSGAVNYQVEVMQSGSPTADTFTICLESEAAPSCGGSTSPSATPEQSALVPTVTIPPPTPAPLPTLPQTGTCVVASVSGGLSNVRGGPGTNYPVVGQLTGLMTAPVVGSLPDRSWFQINLNGLYGWVSATVIRFGGDCSTVPAITLTPSSNPTATTSTNPTETPTATATSNVTSTPTDTATAAPTSSGTRVLHIPTGIAITTLVGQIPINPINPKLDYQGAAKYGEANLSNGFSPDPYSVGTTSGGDVDVSYLGGSCSGFASSAPDLRINFGGGGASLLRIYYVGANGDPAMVVNDPYGNFYCVDDSFGTVNPTIDFNNPAGGSYDVWIASYANNATISGTLYITGNSGNHP